MDRILVINPNSTDRTFGRMVETARRLREAHGADVIVMGCAGMARYRQSLQDLGWEKPS